MIYPSLNQLERSMEKGLKIARFTLEIEGDVYTPVSIFKKLSGGSGTYMLESAEKGRFGRHSYIGRNPIMQIRARGEEVVIEKGGETETIKGSPIEIIRGVISSYSGEEDDDTCDFIGGAVGYVGYDFVRTCENIGEANLDDVQMPDVHLMVAGEIVAYDHERQKVIIMLNVPVNSDPAGVMYEKAAKRLEAIRMEIERADVGICEGAPAPEKIEYSSNETEESFKEKVVRAKEYIRSGDIFQVVISQRLDVKTDMEPFDVYRTLRTINPSPYMYYIDFGDYKVVGSSPELLVKVSAGEVETCPIAGTRPRGADEVEDDANASDLLADEKERAEHLMLVDLARNDIGRIARFGSVELTNFMEIQRYSHVMHIVSNVTGKIRPECDMFDALRACLPAGTVSGAPKVRAMQIIDELENRKRGVYAGAVGYFGFNGNMDTCIAIRTVVFKDGSAHLQAGAGIVADSDPLSEYKETLRKAQALVDAINTKRGQA